MKEKVVGVVSTGEVIPPEGFDEEAEECIDIGEHLRIERRQIPLACIPKLEFIYFANEPVLSVRLSM